MPLAVPDSLLGVLLASVAAVGFAGQFLCIRLGTDDGDVTDAVLVVLICHVVLLAPAVIVLHAPPYTTLFTLRSVASFAAAGIAGMFVARLLMFTSIEAVGASLTSPVIASNVLFATIFAVVFLEEQLTISHLAGIVLIVAGIAVVSWETAAASDAERSRRETGAMLAVPLAAAVCIGIEPIFVSIGLADGTPILPGLLVMASAATAGFVGYSAWTGSLGTVSVRSASTLWYVTGGLSTTVGFVAYFAALTVSPVVLVMPLLQLTPLLVVALSVCFLPQRLERVTWRVTGSAIVVVAGATIVSVVG